jgi:chemotaxis protein methyltransferase CheR
VLAAARALVRDRCGLDFPSRRDADLARALRTASDEPAVLVAALREEALSAPAWRALIGELTVQESYFFRDAAFFAALGEHVLPRLIAERRESGELRLALWSAGCAEGPEPFSLAMQLERMLPDREAWELTILATDIDAAALEAARAGVYGDWALRELPAWARRHFTSDGRRHALDERIRKMVTFAPLNLAMDTFPGSLDVIVCRNVLMYLADDVRAATVRRLAAALAPAGWLGVSPLDSTPELEAPLLEPEQTNGVRLLRRCEERAAASPSADDGPARGEDDALGRDATAAPSGAGSPAGEAAPGAPRAASSPPALERARAAADLGRADAAVTLCLQALRDDPLDAEAHLLMAAVEEERGDLVAAIAAVRRAIYTAPESAAAHFRLGTLLLRRGDEIAARRSLATAAELFGDRAPAPLLARVAR